MDRNRLDSILHHTDSMKGGRPAKGRALVVKLGTESHEVFDIPDNWMATYSGGPALAARLWAAYAGTDVDNPLGYEADNPVVITSSPLSGSDIPMSRSCTVAFRSPQTQGLFFNVCSNSFGTGLALLGYRALIICGRLRRTGVVRIRPGNVEINLSERLTGIKTSQAAALLGEDGIFNGPAGEQHVVYANAVCDGIPTGRGGLGCVLGFKNVKAVTIHDPGRGQLRQDSMPDTGYVHKLRMSGSSIIIKPGAARGWVPVDNFRGRTDPRLFHLTSDEADRRWGKQARTRANHRFLYTRETSDGKAIPGYAENVMLGSNLGCFDPVKVMERYNLALELGLDCVSLGNVLGWAKQTQENGEYPAGTPVDFTDNSQVLPIIESIGTGNPRTLDLGRGVRELGMIYGNPAFAYHINGLECGPYDYRGNFCVALNQALGNWFPVYFGLMPDMVRGKEAFWVSLNEQIVMGLESLGVSPSSLIPVVMDLRGLKLRILAASKVAAKSYFKPTEPAGEISRYLGEPFDGAQIMELGKRCRRIVREINFFLTGSKPGIPDHFCVDPESNCSVEAIVPMHRLLESYFTDYNRCCAIQDSASEKQS